MADTTQIKGMGHYENQYNPQIGEMESTWVQDETPVHTDYTSTYDEKTAQSMLSKAGVDLSKTGYTAAQVGKIPGLLAHLTDPAVTKSTDYDPNAELSAVMKDPSLFVRQNFNLAAHDYGFGTKAAAGDAYNNDKKTQIQDLTKWLSADGTVTPAQINQDLNHFYNTGYQSYNTGGSGWGEAFKMFAPIVLNAFAPGLGQTIGGALGATGTAASVLGGAIVGGGTAALTGGNALQGAIMGGLGSAGNIAIGDTGFKISDLTKASNVIKAASNGDVFSALSGAASMSGLSTDIPIGDTGYMLSDLTKNAALAKAVMSGNPQAVVQAINKFAGAVQANSTNTPTEEQFNAQNQEFINSLAPYESTDPDYLMQLAVNDQQKSATANQAAVDAHTNDIIKQLEQAGLPQDTKGYWDEEHNVFVPSEFGGTTPAQTSEQVSGNPANMKDWSIDDKTGQWTWTNPATGEQTVYDYKTPITGTAQTGAQIENKAGAAPATSPSGTPKASTPTAGTPTAGTPTAGTSSSPTVTRAGLDPLDVLKMKNDVAHINPLEELFGGSIYDQASAPKEQDQTDIVEAATGGQVYSGGGDIHALLQLLRS